MNRPAVSRLSTRSLLVAIGTLPHRDERMMQLQRWTGSSSLAVLTPTSEHCCTATRPGMSSAGCGPHRRCRHYLRPVTAAKRNIKAAVAPLDWLAARELTRHRRLAAILMPG